MTTKTKKLTYNAYKNILNRVAYKLIKSKKSYNHSGSYTIGNKKKTHKEIVATIKANGTNYKNDEFISRFIEDVISKTHYEQLPTSVMGSSGKNKYYRGSYRSMAKLVMDYRKKNGKNPSEIIAKYERIEPLHEYLTNTGCKGMGQCTSYYCACNSLQQAFYRLTGIFVEESTIARWCGTGYDGTGHDGIGTGVAQFNRKYNKNVKINWYNFSDVGWDKLKDMTKKGAVFCHILYRDKWGHYEVIKSIGDDLKVLNSLGDSCGNGTYCGYIEQREKSTQKRYMSGISQKSIAYLTNG